MTIHYIDSLPSIEDVCADELQLQLCRDYMANITSLRCRDDDMDIVPLSLDVARLYKEHCPLLREIILPRFEFSNECFDIFNDVDTLVCFIPDEPKEAYLGNRLTVKNAVFEGDRHIITKRDIDVLDPDALTSLTLSFIEDQMDPVLTPQPMYILSRFPNLQKFVVIGADLGIMEYKPLEPGVHNLKLTHLKIAENLSTESYFPFLKSILAVSPSLTHVYINHGKVFTLDEFKELALLGKTITHLNLGLCLETEHIRLFENGNMFPSLKVLCLNQGQVSESVMQRLRNMDVNRIFYEIEDIRPGLDIHWNPVRIPEAQRIRQSMEHFQPEYIFHDMQQCACPKEGLFSTY